MQKNLPDLFIQISHDEFLFVACKQGETNGNKILYKNKIPAAGILKNQITDIEILTQTLKENIFKIEKKLDTIFKEAILILDIFNFNIINLSGFKKLNGAQLSKENITFILNDLKTKVIETEKDKIILHIFNSNYTLDKKETFNLPIGLFGNFYTHELSFFLIDKNDFKNLISAFERCNLKIRKTILKSFVEGVNLIHNTDNLTTFFKIEINPLNSKIIYFENSSFKYAQDFNFGSELLIKDIAKITSLNRKNIEKFILDTNFDKDKIDTEDYIEKEYFNNENFRKIRKKLIYDIILSRLEEFAELLLFKNINLKRLISKDKQIYLQIIDPYFKSFKEIYEKCFSLNRNFQLNFYKETNDEDVFNDASKIVHFGWNKEAIPVVQTKKTIIARFFDLLFK